MTVCAPENSVHHENVRTGLEEANLGQTKGIRPISMLWRLTLVISRLFEPAPTAVIAR
jgi:hypothetical protein